MHLLFHPIELVNTQEISLDQAQKISIVYISESITLHETEGDALILKEYLNGSSPDLFAQITCDSDGIYVRHGARPVLGMLRGYIEVYLPRQYYGALTVKTISGKITAVNKLVLSDLTLNSTSGRISVNDVTTGSAALSTVSGGIEAGRLQAEADIHSTSGSIFITEASGIGEYKTVSGSIDVIYRDVTGDLSADSVSGRIRLSLPPLLSFSLNAHSISGAIYSPFSGRLAGNKHSLSGEVGSTPKLRVLVKTVSGRIDVLPAS